MMSEQKPRIYLRDIFGKALRPGDIIAYASATGFFITVVREITYNGLNRPFRIRLIYPKKTIGIDGLVVAGKTMYAYQQEFLIISEEDFKKYSGRVSFYGIRDAINIVRGISHYIKLQNGEQVSWVWTGITGRGYGFYFLDELGVDLIGPYEDYDTLLEFWSEYTGKL